LSIIEGGKRRERKRQETSELIVIALLIHLRGSKRKKEAGDI
jgi:hypothetical protein